MDEAVGVASGNGAPLDATTHPGSKQQLPRLVVGTPQHNDIELERAGIAPIGSIPAPSGRQSRRHSLAVTSSNGIEFEFGASSRNGSGHHLIQDAMPVESLAASAIGTMHGGHASIPPSQRPTTAKARTTTGGRRLSWADVRTASEGLPKDEILRIHRRLQRQC